MSALLTQLSWTNHLLILSKSKSVEEREFYILLSIKERYSSRELERQIDSGFFERTMLSTKVSPVMSQLPKEITSEFKDAEYKTKLIDKKILKKKLDEFYQLNFETNQ